MVFCRKFCKECSADGLCAVGLLRGVAASEVHLFDLFVVSYLCDRHVTGGSSAVWDVKCQRDS